MEAIHIQFSYALDFICKQYADVNNELIIQVLTNKISDYGLRNGMQF